MVSRLQQELKQRKPFASLREEVLLSIARTSAVLTHSFEQALKTHGITPTQYNVLRILRGAGPGGLCRYEIGDRLITPVPDVSRLLDRMAAAGMLTRERSHTDRRLVVACITPKGLASLQALDLPSQQIIDAQMSHMSDEQLLALRDLLDTAREGTVQESFPPRKMDPGPILAPDPVVKEV
jgi:DNA-binding MarR family transcriptional regulator